MLYYEYNTAFLFAEYKEGNDEKINKAVYFLAVRRVRFFRRL